MPFLEERLDPRIKFGVRGGPNWKTAKARTSGGQRFAVQVWEYPLHIYDLSQAVKTESDFEYCRAFFYNVAGAFEGFRFKDWSDYRVTIDSGQLALVAGSQYQAEKAYAIATRTYRRPIQKLVDGTVEVFRIRAAVTSNITGSSTVDASTGLVTVTGHVDGDTYRWAGEFDVPVAFVGDSMDAEIVNRGKELLISWPSIQVEEIRLP